MTINTPTSVVAEVINENSYEEGEAAEALTPGEGCYLADDGEGYITVEKAGADDTTRRIVREQRNPPRSLGGVGDSPLDDEYTAGDTTETVGLNRFDRARLRISDDAGTAVAAGDEVGWGSDGRVTDESVGTPIGRVRQVIDRGVEDDLAIVEVY